MFDAKPYGSKILVECSLIENPRLGGIRLPDTVAVDQLPPCQGRVTRVGPRVVGIKDGDTVVFGLGVGKAFGAFVFIDEKDVICRVT